MMNRISLTLHHAYCGYKSGIPFCCILYFITIWTWIDFFVCKGKTYNVPRDLYWRKIRILDAYTKLYSDKIEYVKCPICIILKRDKKIKHCGNPYKKCPKCSIFTPLKDM